MLPTYDLYCGMADKETSSVVDFQSNLINVQNLIFDFHYYMYKNSPQLKRVGRKRQNP